MKTRLLLSAVLLTVSSYAAAQTAQKPAPPQPNTPPAQSGAPIEVDVVGGMSAPTPIAIPFMPTPTARETPAGTTTQLGRQVTEVITADLRNSGLFNPLPADRLTPVSNDQVTAPDFGTWSSTGASALVQGFVRANADGSLTVGCYLYDVVTKTELTRQGFNVAPTDWRRAAHKCADVAYARLTGEGPYFDSRIVYISEAGPKARRIKRLAIMDQDGANHHFLTNGQNIALTPRFAPNQQTLVYMSYAGDRGRVYVFDMRTGQQRLVVNSPNLTFAPRVSPDNRYVVFTMSIAGNANIYRVPIGGGEPQRLTEAPGISTGGSYSPDGSKIVFESDHSGTQQLYVMNADGSNEHRISFGEGRYATPSWSPRGDSIAFTKIGGGKFRIGVMSPSGNNERILTDRWQDEGPTWSPNGRVLTFFRLERGSGRSEIWSVDLTGANERHILTPLDGSDPSWGPLLP
jgi:TolB protein